MDKCWAVAKVDAGGELVVAKRLRMEGCAVYCPAYKWVFHSRRRPKPVERETSLLAGYLFVDHATIGDAERIINWSDFHYFLMFADQWALLADEALDGLRALEACRVMEAPQKLVMPFRPGDVVRVDGGPFGGMRGEVKMTFPGRAILFGWDFTVPSDMPVELLKPDGD